MDKTVEERIDELIKELQELKKLYSERMEHKVTQELDNILRK